MRFLDHIFDDMAVEHLEVKIILPEGTRNIEIKYELRDLINEFVFINYKV